ncbi:hypothetical protein JW964_24520 [candidate division KSB1 bacterium]|nr:hypothetical protein [candidate division KSB1 bacterium]
MKTKILKKICIVLFLGCISTLLNANGPQINKKIFQQAYTLAGERTQQVQYYISETHLIQYKLDGTRTGTSIFKLFLKWTPAKLAGEKDDVFTCFKFIIKSDTLPETTIPVLNNWTYIYQSDSTGYDEKGQMFGIPHDKFENLMDSQGKSLQQDKNYMIYNTFIDFHSFMMFAEKTTSGKGIQNLEKIGDQIVHASAFTEPTIHLGTNIAKGSYFKNGEITLAFKGLSYINESPCALLNFDSGASSFKVLINPMPDMELITLGSSHYKGDIYLDLATKWVLKVVMDEVVISETNLPFPPNKINAVAERISVINNVTEKYFLDSL